MSSLQAHALFKYAVKSEAEALDKAASSLAAIPGVVKVVVFGSRVRGDFSGASDWDILVVVADISLKHPVIHALHDIELEFEIPLAPVIFTSKEYLVNQELKSSFFENIEREGVVVYDAQRQG
jgi:predicted nucleotidyltransferase